MPKEIMKKSFSQNTARTADSRNIPYHMMSCSSIKAVGKEEEERELAVIIGFVFLSQHYM